MSGQSGLLDILSVTAPIFIIVGIGYSAVRLHLMPQDGIRALAIFVVNFAVPALLFKAISERSISEIVHIDFLLAYGLGSLIAFAFVFTLARRMRSQNVTTSAIFGLGGSFSNTLMVGYPVTSALLGSAALVPFALALLVENFLMMPLSLALADMGRNQEKGLASALLAVVLTWLKNPIMMSIFAGVLFSLLDLETPAVAGKVIDLLSKTVTGVGLFVIGGMLVGFKYPGKIRDVSLVMAGKLIIHPLAVAAVFLMFPGMDPLLRTAGIILAAVPMLGIYAVIGQRYELGAICAAVLVPTTVVSFATITTVIWLLTHV